MGPKGLYGWQANNSADRLTTPLIRSADGRLAPTALMNGLLRVILHSGWIDKDYIAAHTLAFEQLDRVVDDYPPHSARRRHLWHRRRRGGARAAELLSTSVRLLSTVLQGFYQSNTGWLAWFQPSLSG